jgi:hypothetical protein
VFTRSEQEAAAVPGEQSSNDAKHAVGQSCGVTDKRSIITHSTSLLSEVRSCSQVIMPTAVAITRAMFMQAYSMPMHLWGPLPKTR